MTAPRVSIVMPMRDADAYLGECLSSIAAQTLADFELLAVDDGSRDAGPARAAAWAGRDRRIRLLRRPPDGLVAALNHGLREARAPLVARMDADDRMHPRRLELQHQAMARDPALVLVGSRVRAFARHELRRGTHEYMRWQNACLSERQIREQIYVESPFTHPSVMLRRDRVLALGGYREGPFPEDYELWLRLAAAGCRMRKLDLELLEWRQHPHSSSRRDPRCSRAAFDTLRARYLAADPRLAPARELVVWGAGRRTRARCRWLLARGRPISAWVDIDPRKIGNRVQGVPVHPPCWLAAQRARVPAPFVLGYVASHGAREQIARALVEMGYAPGRDFLMVG